MITNAYPYVEVEVDYRREGLEQASAASRLGRGRMRAGLVGALRAVADRLDSEG